MDCTQYVEIQMPLYLYTREPFETEKKKMQKYCLGNICNITHWSFHPYRENIYKSVLLHGGVSQGNHREFQRMLVANPFLPVQHSQPHSTYGKAKNDFPPLLWSEQGVAKEQIFQCFTVSALHATPGKNKLSKAHQFYVQINETLMGKGPLGQWFSSSFLLKLPFCPINVPSSLRKILGLP